MKLLKVSILLLGAAGLALLAAELDLVRAGFAHAPLHTGLIVIGWAVPAAMGLWATVRPPQQAWQAAAALAGFAAVAIRMRIWEGIPRFADAPVTAQLGMVAVVAGVGVSIAAVVRPEAG